MIRIGQLIPRIVIRASRNRPAAVIKIAIRGQWTLILGKDCVCRI